MRSLPRHETASRDVDTTSRLYGLYTDDGWLAKCSTSIGAVATWYRYSGKLEVPHQAGRLRQTPLRRWHVRRDQALRLRFKLIQRMKNEDWCWGWDWSSLRLISEGQAYVWLWRKRRDESLWRVLLLLMLMLTLRIADGIVVELDKVEAELVALALDPAVQHVLEQLIGAKCPVHPDTFKKPWRTFGAHII